MSEVSWICDEDCPTYETCGSMNCISGKGYWRLVDEAKKDHKTCIASYDERCPDFNCQGCP